MRCCMENYENYGTEAELAVLNFMNENSGFDILHNNSKDDCGNQAEYEGTMPYKNTSIIAIRSKYGDIEIQFGNCVLKMDVVRGTWISHQAIDKFNGQFYCLFPLVI